MKKLLLIPFLLVCTFLFGQQTNESSAATSKNEFVASIFSVSASPNPFTTETTIHFTSNKNQAVFYIVKNLLGKTVFQSKVDAKIGLNSLLFERNDLSKGMYVYSLQTDTEIISKRLVIR
jgi:hypothetical protein